MRLHDKIMNISCNASLYDAEPNSRLADKTGHRDALHAAAELASEYEAKQAAVVGALVEVLSLVANSGKFTCFDDSAWDVVNDALALAKGEA